MILLLSSLACAIFLFLLCVSDIWFFIRIGLLYAYGCFWQKFPDDLFETFVLPNLVFTSDLDYMLQMNNARYLREADIARWFFYGRLKFSRALKILRAKTVLSASCSRYRRPLGLFERFDIRTRILGWDDHAFYLEQQFVSCQKGFEVAVVHCQHHLTGISPVCLMEFMMQKKNIPEEPCWFTAVVHPVQQPVLLKSQPFALEYPQTGQRASDLWY
ncbi:protein THEM6-like [Heteronotia binoei]|uniref:protein THEM6-like n=1 Tax=Heteronotia binoei TaxID=13085 RepID=UPI00292FCEE1|nr:protein THEM6-like [Heteronotia binoei]